MIKVLKKNFLSTRIEIAMTKTTPAENATSGASEVNGACSAFFPDFISTTNTIWSSNLTRIIEASTDYDLSFDLIAEMLQIASPLRLQLGVQTLPRDYEPVQ
jgi:hypothetical protein